MANRAAIYLEIAREALWWCVSIIAAAAVMYPIYSVVRYHMVWINGLFLVVAFTYFRYSVYLRTTYVLRNKWVRFMIVLFNFNFFVFVLRQQQYFMNIYDSFTIEDMGKPIRPVSLETANSLFGYFFTETTFAVVACLTLTAALSLRIVLAYWHGARYRLNAGNEE